MEITRLIALLIALSCAFLTSPDMLAGRPNEDILTMQQRIHAAQQKLDQAGKSQGADRNKLMQEHMKMMEQNMKEMQAMQPRQGMTMAEHEQWMAEHQKMMNTMMQQMMQEHHMMMEMMK